METLLWILLATLLNGLVAFIGGVTLLLNKKIFRRVLVVLVAFSTGALLGGAFLHLLEESLEEMPVQDAFIILIIGFSSFFLMERILMWRHCHEMECDIHGYSYLVLIGDGIHNFIDGIIIATAFISDFNLGIITTFLIIVHEIPQELGDFAVLVHGGFNSIKALIYNFLSQLTSVVGGLLGYFIFSGNSLWIFMLPFAAGGFIYIVASDLIPELHREPSIRRAMISFFFFAVGIILMFILKILFA
ncbi:MAG TPA: ZIP family metal transporter [Candidatus Altiarchaeales archaeon]|nr:ZIP family metal transporter [Candidatus Altiarchaeales archaeon]